MHAARGVLIALTRPVPASLACCELTHVARSPIDVAAARAEHEAYEEALASLGCDVRRIPAADDLPDSVFVEDTAVVLEEVGIITRPGALSRREETAGVAAALAGLRPLRYIAAPGTLDGGDVLRLDRTLYVGMGRRTNRAGIEQVRDIVRAFGYDVRAVPVSRCLHLKSAVSTIAAGLLLVNPAWVEPETFAGHDCVAVSPREPAAANVLRVGDVVIAPEAHVETARRIEEAGVTVRPVRMHELAKAEAGVTCCSLIVTSGA